MPYINEAAHALEQGVAEPEAIDTIRQARLQPPHGPARLGRPDRARHLRVAILEVLRDGLGDERYEPADVLREHVAPDASAAERPRVREYG